MPRRVPRGPLALPADADARAFLFHRRRQEVGARRDIAVEEAPDCGPVLRANAAKPDALPRPAPFDEGVILRASCSVEMVSRERVVQAIDRCPCRGRDLGDALPVPTKRGKPLGL